MISKLKEVYKIYAELFYLAWKAPDTPENRERERILRIDVNLIFFEFWGNIIVWLFIGFYVMFFINMLRYCSWQDDYSLEAVQRYVKYEVLGIDPVEEQRRLAHEALKEKHRQAAEFYRLQELARKKPPSA
jgi:hypothetical protein